MLSNFLLVLKLTIQLSIEFIGLGLIALVIMHMIDKNKEKIKKYEPAVRERVHALAKAINW